MFFWSELIIIISYLFNDYLGFFTYIVFSIFIMLNSKRTIFNRIISLLILSMPLHSISIIGYKLNHIFSWPIIFLTIISLLNISTIIKKRIKLNRMSVITLIIGTLILIISNYNSGVTGCIKIVQIMLMVIPAYTTFVCRKDLIKDINEKFQSEMINKLVSIFLATAIGVIAQYILYTYFNIKLGQITIFSGRSVFDLLFNAYSVLSLFLGLGIVLIFRKLLEKVNLLDIIKIVVLFIAIIVNSSRTGLVAAIIAIFLMINSRGLKLSMNRKIVFYIIYIILSTLGVLYALKSRSELSNFFYDNGRMETYKYGLNMFICNFKIFFIGNGLDLTTYQEVMPHNFIIETLVTCGIIITIMTLKAIAKFLKFIKSSKLKFLFWTILIGSLFITCFQGNPFTTIIMIITILDQTFINERKNNERKEIIYNNSNI